MSNISFLYRRHVIQELINIVTSLGVAMINFYSTNYCGDHQIVQLLFNLELVQGYIRGPQGEKIRSGHEPYMNLCNTRAKCELRAHFTHVFESQTFPKIVFLKQCLCVEAVCQIQYFRVLIYVLRYNFIKGFESTTKPQRENQQVLLRAESVVSVGVYYKTAECWAFRYHGQVFSLGGLPRSTVVTQH